MKKLTSYSAILLAGFHLSANAQRLTLAIQDNDGKPLNNAVVKVHDTAIKTQANANGLAELDLSPGQYTIDIEWKNGIHFHQVVVLSASDQYDDNNRLVISLKEEPGHKLVIHANPLEHTALDMATPIILLAGDELTSKKAGTLGEILQQEPGLSVSSFGPAVSRPVIRGLSGSRVKITNNQMSVMDASTNSADHDVGMEPLLAEQVEVVKGPATLLYGSGAIGGVVNVTDRKINPTLVDGVTGGLEFSLGDSATEPKSINAQ